ncbi:TIGR02281 family clan AA aspartic protease [Pseudomaricurvus sp. HS19]|uniref:retropepsin-like aspartic protease family protein n=1 Tax=Pseudomaricurvus sp. HS19 TaxID=2692626 RepID=UPI00136FADE5|nr:retropepsin-like aspartic protease [Pseudomaricurvus sp. HS19]MYM64316.1 TIGR02281 family clan AA aspartic protease [Pseudomaricurvus sp. HS19]
MMRRALAVLLLGWMTALQAAPAVQVKALFPKRALLQIGSEQQLLREGESVAGVTLLQANSREALLEIDGKRHKVGVSRYIAASFTESEGSEVRLSPDAGGHYVTSVDINGHQVEAMVDTGATTVVMSLPQAKALGLDYRNGQAVTMRTANGNARAYQVMLERVSVGAVTVENVAALVNMSDFPHVILLGNSFLNEVQMQRENGVLVLRSQY